MSNVLHSFWPFFASRGLFRLPPPLFWPFLPSIDSPQLPTGDFLSILATFFRSQPHPYDREQLEADDGALLNLDWLSPPEATADSPVMIILPGITGHSKSGYLVHMVHGAYKKGWRVVVLVYPGTDMSKVKTARFIRTHVPHDLETTIKHIKKRYAKAPLYAVGYSMGAALLTKYLAHTGSKSRLACAISCSNPFDVLYSVTSVSASMVGKLYNGHFLSALKTMYRENEAVFREAFPHLSAQEVANISSVEEYDTKITMRAFGFENLQEYYVSLGCKEQISDVAIPMLVAHARDDPIVPMEAIPLSVLKENKNIITMITTMGGHTGWLQGLNPMGPSWFDDVALEWIFNMHDLIQSGEAADLERADRASSRKRAGKSAPVVTMTTAGDNSPEAPRKAITSPKKSVASPKSIASPKSAASSKAVVSPKATPSRSRATKSDKVEKAEKPEKALSPSKGNKTMGSPKGRRTSKV